MRQAALLLGVTYLVMAFQTALCPAIRIQEAAPNLLGMEALAVAMMASSPYAFLWSGWIGLLYDLVSADRLGLAMFWFALVGYGVARIRHRIHADRLVVRVGVVLVGTAVMTLGQVATARLMGQTQFPWAGVVGYCLRVGLYTAAVALPVFAVLAVRTRATSADYPQDKAHAIRVFS